MLNEQRKAKIEKTLRRKQPDLQVFLDDVHSSQNNSAILRSADAVGVLHLFYSVRDNENVKIHKTITQGAHRWVSRERIDYETRAAFVCDKQKQGMQVIVTALDEDAVSFREVDFTRPTLLVVGNEKNGVSEELIALADQTIAIPMMGMVQSLNVSVATAITLYEAQRQREQCSMYETAQLSQKEIEQIKDAWLYRDSIARRSKGEIPTTEKLWLDW
jgi:tRNA (guanosine-2'-O-)-methyltransferase